LRYKEEYLDKDIATILSNRIKNIPLRRKINIMEVCGTHTHSIARFGIRHMLPPNINLLSGPGCPVCVTSNEFIDKAIELSKIEGVTIATFGDMFRVPGSYSSLQKEKGCGAKVKIVYSPYDALEYAEKNPNIKVIFLGVGFETTAPTVAATIKEAQRKGISNFYVLSGFKTLPNALIALVSMPQLHIDGFIAPGHLSVVTGITPYIKIAEEYGIPSVIMGFEAIDILNGIRRLVDLISQGRAEVVNEYPRAVRNKGNKKAQILIEEVFHPVDSIWRGIGVIPKSGLAIREEYASFDAEANFNITPPPPHYPKGCICGEILTGVKTPKDCPLFGNTCTPAHPIGACMVSSEGTCAAYYRYFQK